MHQIASSAKQGLPKAIVGGLALYGFYKVIRNIFGNKKEQDDLQIQQRARTFFDWHCQDYKFQFSFINQGQIRIRGQKFGDRRYFAGAFKQSNLPAKINSLFSDIEKFWRGLNEVPNHHLELFQSNLFYITIIEGKKQMINIPLVQLFYKDPQYIQKLRKQLVQIQINFGKVQENANLAIFQYEQAKQESNIEINRLKQQINVLKSQQSKVNKRIKLEASQLISQRSKEQQAKIKQIEQILNLRCSNSSKCTNKIVFWTIDEYRDKYSSFCYCKSCYQSKSN